MDQTGYPFFSFFFFFFLFVLKIINSLTFETTNHLPKLYKATQESTTINRAISNLICTMLLVIRKIGGTTLSNILTLHTLTFLPPESFVIILNLTCSAASEDGTTAVATNNYIFKSRYGTQNPAWPLSTSSGKTR